MLHCCYQKEPKALVTWTDSDFAGCEEFRKSTSAGVAQYGTHLIKSWSTNQVAIALSSGESEYYALVEAGSQSLGIKALAQDMGIEFRLPIEMSVSIDRQAGTIGYASNALANRKNGSPSCGPGIGDCLPHNMADKNTLFCLGSASREVCNVIEFHFQKV